MYVHGENPFIVLNCGMPTWKTRAKRATIPGADPLPVSESEGDKANPKHGQDASAPVNPGEGQLLRAGRSTFRQLHRGEKRSLSNSDSDITSCYMPNYCVCDCKSFGPHPTGADCQCTNMAPWRCVSNVTRPFARMFSCGFIFNVKT